MLSDLKGEGLTWNNVWVYKKRKTEISLSSPIIWEHYKKATVYKPGGALTRNHIKPQLGLDLAASRTGGIHSFWHPKQKKAAITMENLEKLQNCMKPYECFILWNFGLLE